jgi:hypothetical protein
VAIASYSLGERLLHRLVLQPAVVRQLSFDLDRMFARRGVRGSASPNGPEATIGGDRPAYICGLARSGTTILLRTLDRLGVFRSLSYRDMPFVLAPNLWRRASRLSARPAQDQERAHGDGMKVSFDSPEGFEEVFWRTFERRPAALDGPPPERLDAELLDLFAQYRELVANPCVGDGVELPRRRYLSKNNNNLARLPQLLAEPSASVVVAYRDPVATAASLWRQHRHFCTEQARDRFVRDYMGWLGHHEFGLDHRPLAFAAVHMDPSLRPDAADYWLDYWNVVHHQLLGQLGPGTWLVEHEQLRREPRAVLEALLARLGVHADASELTEEIRAPAIEAASDPGFSGPLKDRARAIHGELLARTHTVLRPEP